MHSSDRFRQGFLAWTDEEKARWTLLRAIEWGKWPLFVAQPIAPLLLLLVEWWAVIAGVVAATWLWSHLRYKVVSIRLLRFGPYFVMLKWPASLGVAVYFISLGNYGLAALAGLWPVVTLLLLPFTPRTMIGAIQRMLAMQILRGG